MPASPSGVLIKVPVATLLIQLPINTPGNPVDGDSSVWVFRSMQETQMEFLALGCSLAQPELLRPDEEGMKKLSVFLCVTVSFQ